MGTLAVALGSECPGKRGWRGGWVGTLAVALGSECPGKLVRLPRFRSRPAHGSNELLAERVSQRYRQYRSHQTQEEIKQSGEDMTVAQQENSA